MKPIDESHHFAARTLLGARLKWWRRKHGHKIEAAARELGVSTATWGHWETGHTFPSGDMLLDLCRLTGLPLQLLFCPHLETCPFHLAGQIPPADIACCEQDEGAPVATESGPPP